MQMVEHAREIGGEIAEIERAVVVVGIAIAARVPGGRGELAGEEGDLLVPGTAIAADAVQEKDERPASGDG